MNASARRAAPGVAVALALLVLAGCAPARFVVITPLGPQPAERPALVVGEMTDGLPADVAAEDHPTGEALEKLRGYLRGDLEKIEMKEAGITSVPSGRAGPFASVVIGPADSSVTDRTMILTGKVLSYKRGSRAARYFVGFGAGAGEVVVQFTLREKGRAEDYFVGNFKGLVAGGMFGGSEDESLKMVSRDFSGHLRKTWKAKQ